jgi:hypothetical protein
MKKLILLRGLPGSGKSTAAKLFQGSGYSSHYEADMYFLNKETGEYQFDPSKLKLAHNWCAIQTQKAMVDDIPTIVISNTFTQEWEMDNYRELAKMHDYQVFTLIVENRHGGVNVHGVPDDKLKAMEDRFELKLI